MSNLSGSRGIVILYNKVKLYLLALLVAASCTLLADSLKRITSFVQDLLFEHTERNLPWLLIILPSVGITIIYFTRKYLFKKKQNKGIKEIYETIAGRKQMLPAYKIPSHYINGFFTVIFGGSTGIEVSTVVATAAVGASVHKKGNAAIMYKTELICAGVAAGITVLFASPVAGILFSLEVIAKKVSRTILASTILSAGVAWLYLYWVGSAYLFNFAIQPWHWHALPYFLLLGILCALVAVYFTKTVIITKALFSKISNNFIRVNLGAVLVGIAILCLPYLYGDSYHGLNSILEQSGQMGTSYSFYFLLLALVLIKPLVASLTLGAGGDGGVFAPSIVCGALLGILFASLCNQLLNAHLIVVNFALVGAAAMLSAAIHAPFTAIFLACSLMPGGSIIFIPIAIGSFTAKYIASKTFQYTVYSYKGKSLQMQLARIIARIKYS